MSTAPGAGEPTTAATRPDTNPGFQSSPTTSPSTLTLFSEQWSAVLERSADVVKAYMTMLEAMLQAARETHPRLKDALAAARRADRRLRSTFQQHWNGDLGSSYGSGNSTPDLTITDWIRRAEVMAEEVASARVPMRSVKRQQARLDAATRVNVLLAQREPVELQAIEKRYRQFRDHLGATATTAAAAHASAISDAIQLIQLPPGIGGLDDRRLVDSLPIPGAGPLRLRVGQVDRWSGVLQVGNRRNPSSTYGNASDEVRFETPLNRIPLIIDLDRDGGLVTDSHETATSVLLRLLALLPAGQLRAHVFDPQALGDSVKMLFGLGDVATKIIGTKVKTDARELSELLIEVEEHLTFVTQKYLGGSYDSLTAYNSAADEVAEPYRLLLFFDYPKGFVRADGSHDSEALDRLGKIVKAGPRCGVFTIVVRETLTAAESPISQLPQLFVHNVLDQQTAERLTGLRGSAFRSEWDLRGETHRGKSCTAVMLEGGDAYLESVSAPPRYLPEPKANAAAVGALLAHIERGLATVAEVRVDAKSLHRLASRKLEQAVAKGVRSYEVLPAPAEPDSWWHGDSTDGLTSVFARVGAADVGELTFNSETPSALLGGRPGSGKSVLLHAVIGSLARRYSPEQLELYLVDLREGVEFQVYAAGALPHAKVVAVESEREFALSVLQSVDDEITRRGETLRGTRGEQVELAGYRNRTGLPMPRILVVVDEFHVLFTTDDKLAGVAAQLLDRIIRQGRGFGVHALLASQTLAGMVALGSHTLRQVPVRIALQSDDADSRIVLGDDNPDARLLNRSGEGIMNRRSGLRDANERFQTVFSESSEREQLVADLRALADRVGLLQRPTVFEGRKPAAVDDITLSSVRAAITPNTLALPIGLPMTLGGPVVAELRREPGGNLLIVADETQARPLLTLAVAAGRLAMIRVHIINFVAASSPWEDTLDLLVDRSGVTVTTREAEGKLKELADLVAQRLERSEHRDSAHILLLSELHRARKFDPSGYQGRESELLEQIVKDGPDVGVHTVAWCDKPVSVERRLSTSALREFGVRVVGRMSRDDSLRLVDSDVASTLSGEQLVVDDHDRSHAQRVRGFAEPTSKWLSELLST